MIQSVALRLRPPARARRWVPLVATLLVLAGCATVPPLDVEIREGPSASVLRFGEDTFAFPNESRSLNRGKPDLYANYCFVMTRGVVQFFKFARFDGSLGKLSPEAYSTLVREVTDHSPREPALPPYERVVIPGYRNLTEFSRGEEAAVKAGLNGRFWTLVHWTNWRVVLPVSGMHQEGVAAKVIADLQAGQPVQLLVTNWPIPELNHGVVAYDYRPGDDAIDFLVYDPNDPARPGILSFQRKTRRFWATQLYTVTPGAIRAFRMYYSALL